jgi:uncharacterized protein YbjT (DUF2867 family)
MSKKVLVTGATGQQGGLVARELLKLGHEVRAFVRDLNSGTARTLEDLGATLSRGNFNDEASIDAAMTGIDSVFIVGNMYEGLDKETEQGKRLVDAAIRHSVGHIVYSSVAGAADNSGVPHFDSKYKVEKHLASVSSNWTIVAPVFFMENFAAAWNVPTIVSGKIRQAFSQGTSLQMISSADIGKFAAHVIDQGEPLFGRRIEIAGDALTGSGIAAGLSTAIDKPIGFEVQPIEEVRAMGEDMAKMIEWFESTGYNVQIEDLHAEFNEIDWTTFDDWAGKQNWTALLNLASSAV